MHMICRISQIKCVLTTFLVHKCAFFKNVPFIEFYLHNFKFSCTYMIMKALLLWTHSPT